MVWGQILGLVIFALVMGIVVGCPVYANLEDSWYVFVPMPSDFKYHTKMNWFGCIVCYIVLFILFPILNIGKFIYWLFHI